MSKAPKWRGLQEFEQFKVPIGELWSLEDNPNDGDVDSIQASLERFGQVEPLFYRDQDVDGVTRKVVFSGNHRLEAARRIGWDFMAVLSLNHMSNADAHAYVIAANETARRGSWNAERLTPWLADLAGDDPVANLVGTGFGDSQLAMMLAKQHQDIPNDVPKRTPLGVPSDPVTEPGDVWTIGDHRLICGSAAAPSTWDKVLDGDTADLVVGSPPYADRRKYDESSGFKPIPPDEYLSWFQPIAANAARVMSKNGSFLVNIKAGANGPDTETYVLELVLAMAKQWGWHFATEFCWERVGMPGMATRRLKNQFEPVYQFSMSMEWKFRPQHVAVPSGSAIIPGGPGVGDTGWAKAQGTPGGVEGRTNFDGQHTDGWAFPGNRIPHMSGSYEAVGHAAGYPVGLPAWLGRLFTDAGDVMVDPWCGSGSSLLAAEEIGRRGVGIEISPAYCDLIAHRMQERAGLDCERNGKPHRF